MAAAIILLMIVVLVVGVALNVFLRSWVRAESHTESHLHDPDTHTVAYAVPDGVDPALIRHALSRAGFVSATQRVGDLECLLIECEPGDRDRLRTTLAGVHVTGYDGAALTFNVVFEDER